MRILALEQSTTHAGVALMANGEIVAEREWSETRRRNQQLFEEIPRLLAEAKHGLDEIDILATGLGPGSFTSLRIAVTAARAYALPRQTPVIGIASDAALSLAVHKETGSARVTVIGDARRERLWIARYAIEGGRPVLQEERSMIPCAEFTPDKKRDGMLATPDWVRLQPVLEALDGDVLLITETRIPRARDIARLALDHGIPSEPDTPLTPIYLHPPVFVEPRFPATGAPSQEQS